MKTLDDLKVELFEKLKQCPEIEAFFKDSLQKRVNVDDTWLENDLVVYVLHEGFKAEHTLSQWIQSLASSKRDYECLRAKLSGNHEYDQKIHDVLAEVSAYSYIKMYGFSELKAIPENSVQKTPDYSAMLSGNRYLFEVKNMRSQTDAQDFLRYKTIARTLQAPETYERIQLHFRLSHVWEDISFAASCDAPVRSELLQWLEELFLSIENRQNLEAISRKEFTSSRSDKLKIKCNLKEGRHMVTIGHYRGRLLDVDRMKELPPFLRKVAGAIGRAVPQLFEYDNDNNQCEKYILVSFSYQGPYVLMEDELQAIIHGLDRIVKSINDKIHVRWLLKDKLP